MKRVIPAIALLTLVVFAFACASTSSAPTVSGKIASVNGKALSVTPADGGQPVTVNVGWGSKIYWNNGVEASGTSVLVPGQDVQVWANGASVIKIVVAQ